MKQPSSVYTSLPAYYGHSVGQPAAQNWTCCMYPGLVGLFTLATVCGLLTSSLSEVNFSASMPVQLATQQTVPLVVAASMPITRVTAVQRSATSGPLLPHSLRSQGSASPEVSPNAAASPEGSVSPLLPLAFAVLFVVFGTLGRNGLSALPGRQDNRPLLPVAAARPSERTNRVSLMRLDDSTQASLLNPVAIWESISNLLSGGDPIDISPITPEQLKPMKSEYIVDGISSLLAREIFRLEEGSDLCRRVTDTIENFTLRQYGLTPIDDDLEIFVATSRKTGELAGCVFLKKFRVGDAKGYEAVNADVLPLMESLAVEPKFAGKGIGSMLVRKCEKKAQEWGYNRLMLQVYSENGRAIKFYKKRGYKEVCEDNTIQRPVSSSLFGVRWDEFDHKVMVKQLNSLPF